MTTNFSQTQIPYLRTVLEAYESRHRRMLSQSGRGMPALPERKRKKPKQKDMSRRLLRPIIGLKEVRFFDKMWYSQAKNYAGEDEAMGWYLDVFPIIPASNEPPNEWDSARGKITGEASPTYINSPHAATLIRDALPEIKIIFLLRNPVDRLHSARNMQIGIREDLKSFKEQHGKGRSRGYDFGNFDELLKYTSAWPEQPKNIQRKGRKFESQVARLQRGLKIGVYQTQLLKWVDLFRKEQLMFIRSEDFYSKQVETIHKVEDFLGIKRLPDELWKPILAYTYNLEIDPMTKRYIPVAQLLDSKKKISKKKENMSAQSREMLERYYSPYNKDLEQLLAPWNFKAWG